MSIRIIIPRSDDVIDTVTTDPRDILDTEDSADIIEKLVETVEEESRQSGEACSVAWS